MQGTVAGAPIHRFPRRDLTGSSTINGPGQNSDLAISKILPPWPRTGLLEVLFRGEMLGDTRTATAPRNTSFQRQINSPASASSPSIGKFQRAPPPHKKLQWTRIPVFLSGPVL